VWDGLKPGTVAFGLPDGTFYITEPNKVVFANPVHVPSHDELVALIWRARREGKAGNQKDEVDWVRNEIGEIAFRAISKYELRKALHQVSEAEKRKVGRPRKKRLALRK
jgi:hypothetical protein